MVASKPQGAQYRSENGFPKRQVLNSLYGQLENERASFLPTWRDIGEQILPRRPRFMVSDTNRGERRNQKIIDNTPVLALRTLRSGMMSGVTSPARQWFRLTTPDPELSEFRAVKEWLDFVSKRMSTVFLRSNLYNVLPIAYGDMGGFGTAAIMVEEDFEEVIRCYPFPVGSFLISNNDRLKVDTFARDYRMTVKQLVQRFGKKTPSGSADWSPFSQQVKNLWDNSNYEAWIDVRQSIRPNPEFNPNMLHSKYKKFESCYWEAGSQSGGQANYLTSGDSERYLRESGYDYFPVLPPRWEVTGEDSYGTNCPGIEALGDCKQLQLGEKRQMEAIDKLVRPPMVGPLSLMHSKASIVSGDITFVDEREGQKGFRPAFEVQPRLQEFQMKQHDVQERINRAFFADLFLMLSQSDRREITAREIDERHEEKLLALGPVLEQLNQDLLDPLIDITFDIMLRQDLVPPPPKELQGMSLKVEYLSIMAQAQKLVGIAGVERFAGFVNQLVPVVPDAVDKINFDELVDVYGDLVSIAPKVIRTDEDVAKIRDQKAKAVQAQQQAEQAKNMAGAAQQLSNTPMDTDNALTRMIDGANAGNIVPQR